MKQVPTDDEINYRLFTILGFVPCDGFAHLRKQLRKGKWLLVRKNPENHKQILDCLLINLTD